MDLSLNAERFSGNKYVNLYNRFRPSPPKEILQLSLNYLGKTKAASIIDLGCGTGISTKSWTPYAKKITGIEPSNEMIEIAIDNTNSPNIKYISGYASNIPVPSNNADIVTCSQSFHWMEPKSTLKEVNRVLKKEGVFVLYDIIWPPSVNCEYENAYNELFDNITSITQNINQQISNKWDKKKHLLNIKNSNYFSFIKETFFHKTDILSTEQLIGIALSQGGLEALLKLGFSENEIGLNNFIKKVKKMKITPYKKITYNYRAIFAIK
ncbi:class I SAM-dependent methyltransferase [Galbibacter pacificus]|uniref:Class I SAM-dependent methyltransferase n=1 Tax=Galbibacter pacificus TaxID=2996052 RepID=A0ABT6FW56_9FLAO|nr:class I SAM-dependent methyltransferase [Galbibacter pacificus]MDG3583766.1 class I SAM-dependent methyltransferase [Galbibacter pacificus]MDG3587316.1 class I SAM-dependent methyltransferase [Galbibacter pacificus]